MGPNENHKESRSQGKGNNLNIWEKSDGDKSAKQLNREIEGPFQ